MRVSVLGAGGPAGANTCRALLAAGHKVTAFDQDERHLRFVDGIPSVKVHGELTSESVNSWDADVVLACPDPLVLWLSEHRHEIEAKTFLPAHEMIVLCQDKLQTALAWEHAGLSSGAVKIGPEWADWLHIAASRFGSPYWLRATAGAGAKGAILVEDLRQAYHWMRFWETSGHDIEWMAQEYLPGRDIAWTGIYFHGQLVTSFARERLEYIYPHLTPTGLTGTPTIARVIHDSFVNEMAEKAVAAIDDNPHGIMSVDLRGDGAGQPRPTEINAGRGFTTLGLWSLAAPALNFLDVAAQLASGADPDEWSWADRDPLVQGLTLYRHLDCGHGFVQERGYAVEKLGVGNWPTCA